MPSSLSLVSVCPPCLAIMVLMSLAIGKDENMSNTLDLQSVSYWDAVKDACKLWDDTGEIHYVVSEPATDTETFYAVPERDLLPATDTIHCAVGK